MKSPVEVHRSSCAGSAGPVGLARGELHVLTVIGDVAAGEEFSAVRRALRRLLDDADPPLTQDHYGRPVFDGSPLGIAACTAGRLLVAIVPGMAAAASEVALPAACVVARSLLSLREQRRLDAIPPAARTLLTARLWVRKEAALRLSGHGRLVQAPQVEALVDRPGEPVTVPGSELGHRPFTAHVYDVATAPGYVAAVATEAPVSTVSHLTVTV